MDEQLSDLLGELRDAVNEALLNSERIKAAVAALEQAGRDVQIAIDAVLVDDETPVKEVPVAAADQPVSSGRLKLSATDNLFLHTLRISAETTGR
jgi:hypothetical protein